MIGPASRNEELIRQGYAAFARGDIAALGQLFDPDVVWHAQRLGILGGDHRGWGEVLTFFAQSSELTAGTFRVAPLEVYSNETGAAAVVRSSGRRGEQALDSRQVHLFHLRGDRVVEVWQFVDDAHAVDAFWSV